MWSPYITIKEAVELIAAIGMGTCVVFFLMAIFAGPPRR